MSLQRTQRHTDLDHDPKSHDIHMRDLQVRTLRNEDPAQLGKALGSRNWDEHWDEDLKLRRGTVQFGLFCLILIQIVESPATLTPTACKAGLLSHDERVVMLHSEGFAQKAGLQRARHEVSESTLSLCVV